MKIKQKLKAYWVVDKCNEEGFPVIAENSKEAKKLGYAIFCENGVECEWIDLRVNLIKINFDFSKYKKGELKYSLKNLKIGIFSYLLGQNICPRCGKIEPECVYYEKDYLNEVYCGDCEGYDKCPTCGLFKRNESEEECEDCLKQKVKK